MHIFLKGVNRDLNDADQNMRTMKSYFVRSEGYDSQVKLSFLLMMIQFFALKDMCADRANSLLCRMQTIFRNAFWRLRNA